MKPFVYLFSSLKAVKLLNEFSNVILSFDYRITLVESGKAVYRYGSAELPAPSLEAEGFIPFEEITEDTMISFLRQSMNGQLEEIEQEMRDSIDAANLIAAEVELPWIEAGESNG
jgi:hypothetical protein